MIRNRLVKLFQETFCQPKKISTQYVDCDNCGARF